MRRMMTVLLALLRGVPLFAQKPTVDSSEYAARRARLAKEIGPNGMLVLFSPKLQIRNGDQEWPFRQSDDLLYLTGLDEEETTLVMVPGDADSPRRSLCATGIRSRRCGRDGFRAARRSRRSAASSAWSRRAARATSSTRRSPAGRTSRISSDDERLPPRSLPHYYDAVVNGTAELWTVNEARIPDPRRPPRRSSCRARSARPLSSSSFRDAQPNLVHMREVKSPAEIAVIQRAIDITEAAQKAAMKRVLTATSENQVDAVIDFTYKDQGTCCWAFPSIAASGANTTTLHYMANNGPVDRAALFLTDLGAEYMGYSADMTRTYPASGRFTSDQRAIHDAVFAAQEAAIAALKPGGHFRDADHAAIAVIGRELARLGLISKEEPRQVFMYFRHVPAITSDSTRTTWPTAIGRSSRTWSSPSSRGFTCASPTCWPARSREAVERRAGVDREGARPLRRHRRAHRRQRDDHRERREAAVLGSPRKSEDIERYMASVK